MFNIKYLNMFIMHAFLNKNKLYKNNEAEIGKK